jgi:hypothetical protein
MYGTHLLMFRLISVSRQCITVAYRVSGFVLLPSLQILMVYVKLKLHKRFPRQAQAEQ